MRVCLFRHSREKRAQGYPSAEIIPKPPTPRVGRGRPEGGRTDSDRARSGADRPGRHARKEAERVGGLQNFEHRLEQLISGAFARRSAAPCSRSRSPPRCSASATTTPRSSPATGGWCPTTSTSSCPRPTSTGSRRTTPRWRASCTDQLEDHAEQQGYVFPGPVTHRVRGRRRPHHRPVPDPQPGAGPGDRQRHAHPGTPGPRPARGQRHPAPAAPARRSSSAAAPRPTSGSTTRA